MAHVSSLRRCIDTDVIFCVYVFVYMRVQSIPIKTKTNADFFSS